MHVLAVCYGAVPACRLYFSPGYSFNAHCPGHGVCSHQVAILEVMLLGPRCRRGAVTFFGLVCYCGCCGPVAWPFPAPGPCALHAGSVHLLPAFTPLPPGWRHLGRCQASPPSSASLRFIVFSRAAALWVISLAVFLCVWACWICFQERFCLSLLSPVESMPNPCSGLSPKCPETRFEISLFLLRR